MRPFARTAVAGIITLGVLGALSCSSDTGNQGSCGLTSDSTSETRTVTIRTEDDILTRVTRAGYDGSVHDTLTIDVGGRPYLSTTITNNVDGSGTIVSAQRGVTTHLITTNGQDWTGDVNSVPIMPLHATSGTNLENLLRYQDGRSVVGTATNDAATTRNLDALISSLAQAQRQCTSTIGGGLAPLDAVQPAPQDTRASAACSDCQGGCRSNYVNCTLGASLGCSAFLAVPLVGGALFGACVFISFLVCTTIFENCTSSCESGSSCCPVPCGTDSTTGEQQCCEQGGACYNSDTHECCPASHPQVCGTGNAGVCCLQTGQDSCVVSPAGIASCCPMDGHHQTCGASNAYCCNLTTAKCATDYFTGQAGVPSEECCPLDRLCGDTCCDNGFLCNASTHTCECGGFHAPCGTNCCEIGQVCGNPATGECCPGNTRVCGHDCCPSIAACTTVNGQEACCPSARACGTICCDADQQCGNALTSTCCATNVSVCGGACCPTNSPCTALPDGSSACCGQNGTTPCGTECCVSPMTCSSVGGVPHCVD